MKKSTGPAKRSARARIIELNGPAERVELLLLIFMAPLWGIVFPLIGLSTLATYAGVTLLGASIFCFLHFLHLNNSRFSFEEKGVRLPGVDHRLHPYTNIKRIYLESVAPLLLAVEFVPLRSILGKEQAEEQPVAQLFEIQHLTEESARQMWGLFASHLRSAIISLDVRDKLVNWRTQGTKDDRLKISADPVAHNQGNGQGGRVFPLDRAGGGSSEIARDLSMTVELKPFDPIKLVGQYMVSYSDTFRKTWLTCWSVVAAVAYPIAIGAMLTRPLIDRNVITESQTQSAASAQSSLGDWINANGPHLTTMSQESLANLFGNHIGMIGLFVLLYFAIYKFMRHLNDPDSMFIDYMGITTQKRTPAGVLPKEHRSWKTIDQIHLVRPHEKSNSSRWSIVFECNQEKEKISVPFKAFSSDRVRQQFIECLDTWGRNINTDPNLLEALAPRGQASYTELWLSALSEAPKIDELTPHSVGLRLQNRAYEIECQLASGGQGVAYLARKMKTPLPLVGDATEISGDKPAEGKAIIIKVGDGNGAGDKEAHAQPDEEKVENGRAGDGKAGEEQASEERISLVVAEEVAGGEKPAAALKTEAKADEKAVDGASNAQAEAAFEHVVLKETVLPIYVDDRARAKALARFERDAKLLASLNHPLIVRLEDFFVENNRAYLALEYIHGKTLKEKVDSEGPLPEEEVKRLAVMMTDILEYLHNRTPQVVHRDFTPDNLMLTNDGKIKLIDFDVALEQSSFSQTNATIVGKQAYIPLEQFRGKPCIQSDIYALGATLTYLLTGQEPDALQSSHPRQTRPDVSEELDDIIARATALELTDRYGTARELRQRLLGETIEADAAAEKNGGSGAAQNGDGENADIQMVEPESAVKLVVASETSDVKIVEGR